ncbi:MAG: KH domain-containing protein [Christensenellaceae bacterium]|jgi:predicted RNA-binding protein YlqC (UPF0109 family)|nr:KH domain-containing protein [Christensenellaceae bacterium]
MENLVKYLVENLVEDKSAIKIETTLDGDMNIIHVAVAEGDIGRVVGKGGKIAGAIRTIVRSASKRTGKKYVVKIN